MSSTNVIHIDAAQPHDAAEILEVYQRYVEDTSITFETSVPAVADIVARMHAGPGLWLVARAPREMPSARDTPFSRLLGQAEGELIGYAYAGPHRTRGAYQWASETSVYLAQRALGRGVGSALYQTLFALLPALGVQTALAGVALPNEASVSLHRRFGFVPVGTYHRVGYKAGAYRDVMWMERILGNAENTAAAPSPLLCWADLEIDAQIALWADHVAPPAN